MDKIGKQEILDSAWILFSAVLEVEKTGDMEVELANGNKIKITMEYIEKSIPESD